MGMFFIVKRKWIALVVVAVLLAVICVSGAVAVFSKEELYQTVAEENGETKSYIKWVDFNLTASIMSQALSYDLDSYGKEPHLNWIELLAYTSAKNYGNLPKSASKDLDAVAQRIQSGEKMEDITNGMPYYAYYLEAYTAILEGFVGEYTVETEDPENEGQKIVQQRYGLKAYSPIAGGYSFSHYDDFGASRSYGYRRKHLGNDLMGSVGTPIIAVESGVVEALGWNQYGGWRVGIRSLDGKRYYYYAHLRRDHPFHYTIGEGDRVNAGDVIGYLGMTGYSAKENVNNINTPHLHFGLQLIFDESQKDGDNQIWIDVYELIELLQKNKCAVQYNEETKDYDRVYDLIEPD